MDKTDQEFARLVSAGWTQRELDEATKREMEAAFKSPAFCGLAKLVGYVFRHSVNGDMY